MVTPTVVNNGPSYAQNTVVTVTLAPSTTFNPGATVLPSGWYSSVVNGFVVITTSVPLTPDTPIDLPIVVDVAAGVLPGTSLQFNGTTSSSTPDPDATNNTANADTSVIANADLAVSKTATQTTVVAGQLVTYTIVVTNNGPSTASSVNVVDALPAGFGLVSVVVNHDDGQAHVCATTNCEVGNLPVGRAVTLTVVGLVASNVAAGTVLTNVAQVTAATIDPNSTNNTASQATPVKTLAGLFVAKTVVAGNAVAGLELTYLIVVTNVGPSAAVGVVVTDMLPVSTTHVSNTGNCQLDATGRLLTCNLGTLAANAATSVAVTVRIDQALADGAVVTNTALLVSNTPLAPNSQPTATIPTQVKTTADLALFKAAPATVVAGETVRYTLTVVNRGPSTARSIVVTDVLPARVSYVAGTAGCAETSAGSGVVTCTYGVLASWSEVAFLLAVRIDGNIEPGSSLENRAHVAGADPDPDLTNNEANADTSVLSLADVVLEKSGPVSATAGEIVTYTIVVTNAGPSVARFVDVKDELPAGVSLRSATVERTGSGVSACAGAVCQVGSLPVGEIVTLTVVGQLDPALDAGVTLSNTATVFAVSPDPDPSNNQDHAQTTVATLARIRIEKRDLIDPVSPDSLLVYQVDCHQRRSE